MLENEETPLEDSIQLFEEGIQLKDFCEEKLKSAKLKINKIIKNWYKLGIIKYGYAATNVAGTIPTPA